jgi:hypothetical protein
MNKLKAGANWEGYNRPPQFIKNYGTGGLQTELGGGSDPPNPPVIPTLDSLAIARCDSTIGTIVRILIITSIHKHVGEQSQGEVSINSWNS